jgi:TonB family protein
MSAIKRSAPSGFFPVGMALLCLLATGLMPAHSAAPDEDIETLDMIEITSTTVEQDTRNILFPVPQWPMFPSLLNGTLAPKPVKPVLAVERDTLNRKPIVLLDQSTETGRVTTPVKPLRAERPPFPRQAREQGWHGVVLLNLTIDAEGQVLQAEIKKSSGYTLLDSAAVQSVKRWTFEPAKNGNFSVSSVVNLPIKFDLHQ